IARISATSTQTHLYHSFSYVYHKGLAELSMKVPSKTSLHRNREGVYIAHEQQITPILQYLDIPLF
ncbi:TPA: hypothetical protein ACIRIK_002121, partial [Streptococcus suis]